MTQTPNEAAAQAWIDAQDIEQWADDTIDGGVTVRQALERDLSVAVIAWLETALEKRRHTVAQLVIKDMLREARGDEDKG